MLRLRWVVPFVVVGVMACKGEKREVVGKDAALPDRGSAEMLPAQKVTQMGEALGAEAGAPVVEVDGEGMPVVAWIEAGRVQVRRWDGKAWVAMGAAINDGSARARGVPVMAREAGGMLIAWVEPSAGGVDAFEVARWKDGAWARLGSVSGASKIADGAIAASDLGPVAVWREAQAGGAAESGDVYVVHAAVLEDAGWKPIAGGMLRGAPDAAAPTAAALATRPGQPIVVAWLELSPAPTLHVRRWAKGSAAWEALPIPEGADAQSTIALTMTPNGSLYLALGYAHGLRQIRELPVGAGGWNIIGVPESANGPVAGQRLASGDDGRVVFTYPFGGRYAYWDGRRWAPTSVGVMSPSTIVPAAAVGKNGKTYVAWSDSTPGAKEPARVRVYEVE